MRRVDRIIRLKVSKFWQASLLDFPILNEPSTCPSISSKIPSDFRIRPHIIAFFSRIILCLTSFVMTGTDSSNGWRTDALSSFIFFKLQIRSFHLFRKRNDVLNEGSSVFFSTVLKVSIVRSYLKAKVQKKDWLCARPIHGSQRADNNCSFNRFLQSYSQTWVGLSEKLLESWFCSFVNRTGWWEYYTQMSHLQRRNEVHVPKVRKIAKFLNVIHVQYMRFGVWIKLSWFMPKGTAEQPRSI